ncbi:hypothetical protein [Roseimicrobium sp. ORNL1]|uniref:hypothetical protein n=1 Tax=Roseimicrobium sp. ORNL1 TaxID=2711231 RepID=UPI0013E1AC80|nr:hypothetical protein [Roseimicrobium sp. ORNL1]QIF05803.1 hypothetical protein G5S37_31355 [Roseimicrobium sp. ORNL1]
MTATAAMPSARATDRLFSGISVTGMVTLAVATALAVAIAGKGFAVNALLSAKAEVANIRAHAIFTENDIVVTN